MKAGLNKKVDACCVAKDTAKTLDSVDRRTTSDKISRDCPRAMKPPPRADNWGLMRIRSSIAAAALAAFALGGAQGWADAPRAVAVDPLALDMSSSFGNNASTPGTDAAAPFAALDSQATPILGGLLPTAASLNSPYAPLAIAGDFGSSTVSLGDDFDARFAGASLDAEAPDSALTSLSQLAGGSAPPSAPRVAEAGFAGVDWNFSHWGALGLQASQSSAESGAFGAASVGPLELAKNASTSAIGTNVRVGFGNGWVTTVSYSQGTTNLDLKSSSLVSADTFASRAYGFAIAKRGVFDNDDASIGFAVSRPIQVYSSGGSDFQADGLGVDGASALGRSLLGQGQAQETDLSLGYVTSFMDGALALQANAGYQMNLYGQTGQNGVSFISRAKINF
jgi:hypothetical protein